MNAERRPDRLLRLACCIARADFDLASVSNHFDRMTIVANAALLLALGVLAAIAWTAFWASFLPLWVALPLGLLVGAIVFGIDQAIAASDWELAGVLRTEPPGKAYWFKATARVLFAFLLAQATATGVTLWMFGDTIEAHLQDQRTARNVPIEIEYAKRKEELKASLLDPITKEIEARQLERAALQRQVEQALTDRDTANRNASQARIEAGREADGGLPGYIRGEGPRYREAKRQEAEAAVLATGVSNDVRAWQTRIGTVEQSIAQLTTVLDRKQAEYHAQAIDLDAQKQRDPRWVLERNDPLMRYIALHEIQQDAKVGGAAKEFRWLMVAVLLTLELSFLIVKLACAPASVYTVRLIARTKREASEVSAEHARDIESIHSGRPRGNLRVVGGQADEDRHE